MARGRFAELADPRVACQRTSLNCHEFTARDANLSPDVAELVFLRVIQGWNV
jgi:hypothetical protein